MTSTEPELVPRDDTIIGKAFRWSLAVFAVLGAGIALMVALLQEPEAAPPPPPAPYVPPRALERIAVPPLVTFTDVTAASGIDFVHENGASGEKLLPETMGAGCALFDYDDDGDLDVLLVNGRPWDMGADAPTSALFANDGSGRFEDVSAEAGIDVVAQGMGCAVGDVDGDGDRDVFLTAVGSNILLVNEDGRFSDATGRAGVAGAADQWSTSAAFFDYDRDGDLDLFVCNYVRWSREIDLAIDYQLTGVGRAYGPPTNFEGAHSTLYRNDGDGTFTDVSAEAGIQVSNPATGVPVGKALGVAPVDVDDDGWIDLIVANDTVRNFLFRNRGDGGFEEIGQLAGLAFDRNGMATGAMGIDVAHFRNDTAIGVAIGNFANEMSSLYVRDGTTHDFSDEAIGEGIGAPTRRFLSFGLVFLDYDLDGRLDLLQANGHLEDEINLVQASQHFEQPPQLFWNAGAESGASFVEVDVETAGDLAEPLVGRAAATGDLDGDGDLDLLITQAGRRPALLRNDQALGNHWLHVRLVDDRPGANRDALGAHLTLEAGGSVQHRRVMPSRSYLAQVAPEAAFGLGVVDAVDALRIRWPDGTEQTVDVPGVDRLLVVRRE